MTATSMTKPRVGIFMPAYNQGRFIFEALESLNNQTFQNFEVSVVDDCSTDNVTIPTLKSINHPKVSVHFQKSNQGIGVLTKKYCRKLKNEYIFILCADDLLDPRYIEKCVTHLDKHKNVAAVATWIQCFGENSDLIELDLKKSTLPHALVEGHFLGSAMMRRSAFEEIDFGLTMRRQNDYDRWVSMMERGWKLAIIKEPLFLYRQLNSSLSHTNDIAQEIEFKKMFIERHKGLFEKNYSYVLLELYRQLYESKNWQRELTNGRDWLASRNESLELENKKLLNDLTLERNLHQMSKAKLKYGFTFHPILGIIKRAISSSD